MRYYRARITRAAFMEKIAYLIQFSLIYYYLLLLYYYYFFFLQIIPVAILHLLLFCQTYKRMPTSMICLIIVSVDKCTEF